MSKSTAGTNIPTNAAWSKRVRYPCMRWEVNTTGGWIERTADAVEWTLTKTRVAPQEIATETSGGHTSVLSILLHNWQSGQPVYSLSNSALGSAFSGHPGLYGVPVRLSTGFWQRTAGTVTGSATSTGFHSSLTQANGYWTGGEVVFTSGALRGWSKPVSAYLNSGGAFSLSPSFFTAPAVGDTFLVRRKELLTQFTGVVAQPSQNSALTRTVRLECRGMGERMENARINTPLYENVSVDSWLDVLATAAGYTSGADYFPASAGASRTLEPGYFTIPVAWAANSDPATDMVRVAISEAYTIYFGDDGLLHGENFASRWYDHTTFDVPTPSGSFSTGSIPGFSGANCVDIQPIPDTRTAVRKVRVEQSARQRGVEEEVFKLVVGRDFPSVPHKQGGVNGTLSFTATFKEPTSDLVTPEARRDYFLTTRGRLDLTGFITVTLSQITAQSARVVLSNSHDTLDVNVTRFRLRGHPWPGIPFTRSELDISGEGENPNKIIDFTGNEFIAAKAQTELLVAYVGYLNRDVSDTYQVQVPALPWIEPGDLTTVVDPRNGTSVPARVIRDEQRWNSNKYSQTLTAVKTDVPATPYFITGHATKGVLGGGGKLIW